MTTSHELDRVVSFAQWIPITGRITLEADATRLIAAVDRIGKATNFSHGVICVYLIDRYFIGLVPTLGTLFSSQAEFANEVDCFIEYLVAQEGESADKNREVRLGVNQLKSAMGRAALRAGHPVAIEAGNSRLRGELPKIKAQDDHEIAQATGTILGLGMDRIRVGVGNRTVDAAIDYSRANAHTRQGLMSLLQTFKDEIPIRATEQGGVTVDANDLLPLLRRKLYGGALPEGGARI